MKHAGPEALDQLEPILEEIRRSTGSRRKSADRSAATRAGFCISTKTRRDFLPI